MRLVEDVIEGFAFTGYRSFRGDVQVLAPLGKVNLLAGQNNAGKSNVLRFAQQYLRTEHFDPPADLDKPFGGEANAQVRFAIARRVDDTAIQQLTAGNQPTQEQLRALLARPTLHLTDDDLVWFRYSIEHDGRGNRVGLDPQWCSEIQSELPGSLSELPRILSLQFKNQGGGEPGHDVSRVLDLLDPRQRLPEVTVVDAFRQIAASGSEASGGGLVEALARLQNPDARNQTDRLRFDEINLFLQTVLDDPNARLEVPYARDTLLVHQNGGVPLPLAHYGTGVHQVVILAAAATIRSGHLICIEEPEVHLHPLLQRKLVRFLAEKTENQYLIATHSAHMLDYENANVFHLRRTPTGSQVDPAVTPVELSALCADLGYRPSDLFQANAVIWVEGPSDRIYVRHWLRQTDPGLIEGIHYSIMFYGGRLLNHLTVLDDPVKDFIGLRRLNRHSAIVIDSDRTSKGKKINDTKARVRDEFDDGGPGFACITHGYTIENYVPAEMLNAAVAKVHPNITLSWTGDLYSNPLAVPAGPGRRNPPSIDKIAVAHVVCDLWTERPTDPRLLKEVVKMVRFIREANGLSAATG